MNPLVLQYVLPALLGYTLYIGIADRISLRRPSAPERRPGWLLGAGIGLATSGVIATVLTLAEGLNLSAAMALLAPAGLALAALYTCALLACSWYRRALRAAPSLDVAMADSETDPVELDERADWATALDIAGAADDGPAFASIDVNDMADMADMADSHVAEANDTPTTADTCDVAETPDTVDAQDEAVESDALLDAERRLREQTEQHLRVTRKALYVLENEARQVERRDEELLALETQLADGVREMAAAQARAERESFARIAAETTISEQREDLLRAQRDVRRNVEARARALSAANKALSCAKRSTRSRHRLAAELEEARATITNRQETISSLIRALEKEKRRTGEEVTSLAKQLVLHERQLKARRSLEEVARSVEGKLTTRLVKKVAKARPVLDRA